jgi:tungstate transport system ATP-binding protein
MMQRATHETSDNGTSAVLPIVADSLRIVRGGRALIDTFSVTISGRSRISVILGPNGAGKSLTVRALAGLIAPDEGHVTWAGQPVSEKLRSHVGVVFQKPVLLRRSAQDNIVYALTINGTSAGDAARQATEALASAGLAGVASSPARALSGGEQQRLALARALALKPDVLFLDEPTANVDPASTGSIEKQIKAARDAGTRICLVTQDLGQARRLADDVWFMHRGRIVEHAGAQAFFAGPQSNAARQFVAGEIVEDHGPA